MRQYSKNIRVANGVSFTGNQVTATSFTLQGTVYNGAEFACLRVAGNGLVCQALRVDAQVPGGDPTILCSLQLQTGSGSPVAGAVLTINGSAESADLALTPPLQMPAGSVWKVVASVTSTALGASNLYPRGLTLQYLCSYGSGAVQTGLYSNSLTQQGIGANQVGYPPVIPAT
jgi:hypothetical protein